MWRHLSLTPRPLPRDAGFRAQGLSGPSFNLSFLPSTLANIATLQVSQSACHTCWMHFRSSSCLPALPAAALPPTHRPAPAPSQSLVLSEHRILGGTLPSELQNLNLMTDMELRGTLGVAGTLPWQWSAWANLSSLQLFDMQVSQGQHGQTLLVLWLSAVCR